MLLFHCHRRFGTNKEDEESESQFNFVLDTSKIPEKPFTPYCVPLSSSEMERIKVLGVFFL